MNLQSYLPTKSLQRIIIIILAVILVSFVVYTLIDNAKERKEARERGIDVSFVEGQESTVDTDGDGVYDWEEKLWGLNPNNPDTDGDGISDGIYVRTKKSVEVRRTLGIENVETNLTETEKLGRSLYTTLLAISESGGSLNANSQSQISENISEYALSIPLNGEFYFREDLNLVEDTKENSYRYREKVLALLEEFPVEAADIELIMQAVENSKPYATRINNLSIEYESFLIELSELEVPYAIAGRHTELLNGIANLTGGLKNLNQGEPDELLSLSLLAQMDNILNHIGNSVTYMNQYFEIIKDESLFSE